MPRVFSQESGLYEPTLYTNSRDATQPTINNGNIVYGKTTSTLGGQSQLYIEHTNGETLASLSLMLNQISLKPHSYNAGNYYNLPTQLGDASNTVCAKGWSLPLNSGYSILINFYNFLNTPSNKDSALLNLPLSFLRSGSYGGGGSLDNQGSVGRYRMPSLRMDFDSSALYPTHNAYVKEGLSVRCVSR